MRRDAALAVLSLFLAACSSGEAQITAEPQEVTHDPNLESSLSPVERPEPVLAQTDFARALTPALLDGPTLGAGRANEATQRAALGQAQAAWRPSLSAGIDAMVGTASDAEIAPFLQLSQRVFDGGVARNRTAAADLRLRQAAARTAIQVSERALAAADAWENAYLASQLVRLAQTSVARHDRVARMVEMRVQAGAGRNAETLRVASRRAEAAALLASAQSNLVVSQARLREIFDSTPSVGPLPRAPAATGSLHGSPVLRALQAEAAATQRDRAAVRASRMPSVFFDVVGSAGQDSAASVSAGLRVAYDFGTNGAQNAAEASADAAVESLAAEIALAESELGRTLATARARQAALSQELVSLRSSAETARAALDDAVARFDSGRIDVLDLLELGRDVDRAERRLAELESEHRRSGYSVLHVIGELLDRLGICLEGCAP